jgi:phosphoribosylamine--glycine ligase
VTILILGSGGREHALAWRMRQDPSVDRLLAAPGNPGIGTFAELLPAPADVTEAAELGLRHRVSLTIVGPELPLSQGIVDAFDVRGLPIVGPTRAAAALEWSKGFAKAFMQRHGVPTARHRLCHSEEEARSTIASGALGLPLVVKADGLAAGKGVVVAADAVEANRAVTEMMGERRFGDAGSRVVLEEYLSGPELSFFVLTDGERVMSLGSAQDHKRVYDGDEGPNTGGMGAFAPSPLCDPILEARVMREIVRPVIEGMRQEGRPYRGFLYCGLMLTGDGPRVIEFNVRFGDPEAQVLLPLITGDLVGALRGVAAGDLKGTSVGLSSERAVGVVLASGGYPDRYDTGKRITGLEAASAMPGVLVFHAGTSHDDGHVVTAGGRVLTIVGLGSDYQTACSRAYEATSRVRFDGMHARTDIGAKAINAQRPTPNAQSS